MLMNLDPLMITSGKMVFPNKYMTMVSVANPSKLWQKTLAPSFSSKKAAYKSFFYNLQYSLFVHT